MDDEFLRLEFGDGALDKEDKNALFKAVDSLCVQEFGKEFPATSLKNSYEVVLSTGTYAKLSRLIIRSTGCVIGSVIEIEYFSPIDDSYDKHNNDYLKNQDQDEDFFLGKYSSLTFDTTDGSFFRTESISKLYMDDLGQVDLEDIQLFDSTERRIKGDEIFEIIMENEAKTLTVDDYFIVNTVRQLFANR